MRRERQEPPDLPECPRELLKKVEHVSTATFAAVTHHWESIPYENPPMSLEWAHVAAELASKISSLLRGRAKSIQGGSYFQLGDYANAEICYCEAAVLLADYPTDRVDNIRRVGGLRIAQKSFAEARRLFNQVLELSRAHGSGEQVAKGFLALGCLEVEMGNYDDAAQAYKNSLQYLSNRSPTYSLALHNLLCVTVRLRDFVTISELAETIRTVRKTVPRLSLLRVRLDWLLALGSMQLETDEKVLHSMQGMIGRLERRRCRPDEIATAAIDLAQVYYKQGNRQKACATLEKAREYFSRTTGTSPEAASELTELIDRLQAGDETAEPWDIRRPFVPCRQESTGIVPTGWTAPAAGGKISSKDRPQQEPVLPADPRDLLSADRISPEILDAVIHHWESLVPTSPQASFTWAEVAVSLAERIGSRLRGIAKSIQGGSHFQLGDYANAEKCFHEAAALLADYPADRADNLRRIGGLRIVQNSHQEARRLFKETIELSRNHGSEEQSGKSLLALGCLEVETGNLKDAARAFTSSLQYVNISSPTYPVAVHNLLCSMIRLKDFKAIAELTKAVKALSKTVPRFHAARARLRWVITLGLMRLGADRPAIGALPGIIHRLEKDGCRPDEVAAAMMDLAQAYYNEGNWEKACAMLEEAREQYRLASGVSPAVVADLNQLIDELRSGSRTGEPWAIRPLLGRLNLPTAIPECETITAVFPGTPNRHFIPDRPNPNPAPHSGKKVQRTSPNPLVNPTQSDIAATSATPLAESSSRRNRWQTGGW